MKSSLFVIGLSLIYVDFSWCVSRSWRTACESVRDKNCDQQIYTLLV